MMESKLNKKCIRREFLVFGSPLIEDDEIEEVVDSLKNSWLGTGPKVARFERSFAEYKGLPFAVAVNSCTASMHLSLLAAGVGQGDEVISTAMTFCATVNAIIHCGAKPVLVDCDPGSFNIDVNQIEKAITPRTKALVIVHFAGRPCPMDKILEIVKKYNIILIEDCAHAIETEYQGQKAGTFGDFGCFSFYATKNMTTGEGGMIITNNKDYEEKLKIMALHGMSNDAWGRFSDEGFKHYWVTTCGYKFNMMDIQAAIGLHQIQKVEGWHTRRSEIWQRYMDELAVLPIQLPLIPEKDTRHAYHLFTILIDPDHSDISRDEALCFMQSQNIGVGVHYLSVPQHPYYQRKWNMIPKDYPNAYQIGQRTLSLPLSPKLTDDDVTDVICAVRKMLRS